MSPVSARKMFRDKFLLLGVILLAVFGSDSHMAPVAAGHSELFDVGTRRLYDYSTTVNLNEGPGGTRGKDVGYRIRAEVGVAVVWKNPLDDLDKLLEIQVIEPKLLIKSRKAPAPEGFVVHSSGLESAANSPYLVRWTSGTVGDIYVDVEEDESVANLKRGISGLFQFQAPSAASAVESDSSGRCTVLYAAIDSRSFTKSKTDCVADAPHRRHTDPVLRGDVNSTRTSTYVLSKDLTYIESVRTWEEHELRVAVKRDVGGMLSSRQKLTAKGDATEATVLKSRTLSEAIEEFGRTRRLNLARKSLAAEVRATKCEDGECPSLPKLVKDNRDVLSGGHLGSLRSATAFLKLLSAARAATKDQLSKAFKGTKNKEIMAQLCDLAGAVQTADSHRVVTSVIKFDADEDLDNWERYLWSLSAGSHPNEAILKDLYERSQRGVKNEKLSETLLLTVASMASKCRRSGEGCGIAADVSAALSAGLESCGGGDDACKCKYLRALKNLRCPGTVGSLVRHALNGTKKVSVCAMKALRSFDRAHWSPEVVDAAQRIYFQIPRRFDSSSRTLALDILLESESHRGILQEVLLSLARPDPAYEVKQYLAQRVRQLSEGSREFADATDSILRDFKHVFNNYHVRAQRGLTTAFTRAIATADYRNASLVAVQELQGGFLKRGFVDVVVETSDATSSLFTLGLFAGGLGSFVSSGGEKESGDEEEEEEPATAGMELTVMGTQLRPFVFFSGQGELMGHVWSGTASDKTPAYQAFIVTQDHLEHVPLQNGLASRLQLLGVVSFDLSGQVQLSLWNRNAHSLVEKNAGIFLQGMVSADMSFVRSKVEFSLATEAKLNLVSDVNFYNDISLCMQLSQPDSVVKHNIHKIERIPGSKHRLRKSKYKQTTIPGRTYALNRKNNEMCNAIFREQ